METGIVYTGFLAFVTEMFAPLLLCSSIPLGSPPVQDPNLGKIAPKQCVFYVGWAGMGAPDAKSANSAERFLADPEIRHMRAEAARRFRLLMKAAATSPSHANGNGITVGPCSIPSQISNDAEFWCELLVTRPCAGFVGNLAPGENEMLVCGASGFVMNVGDSCKKVAAMLRHYRELAKDAIEEKTVDGRIEYHLKIDDPSAFFHTDALKEAARASTAGKGDKQKAGDPLNLRWTLRNKYLIVTWGDTSPAKILERMKGPEPKWLVAVGKDLPIERRAVVLRVDLAAIAAPFAKGDAEDREVARQIKDTHLRAVTLVTGLGHDDFVSQLLVETDGIAGALLKTIVDRPLKAEDLAVIPRDATLAMALRFNPNLIATGLRWLDVQAKEAKKNSAANADKNANEQPPQTETAVPIDVQNWMMSMAMSPGATAQMAINRLCRKPIDIALDDEICTELAASLDDAWRLYTSPGEGSSIFNGMTGVVHVKDAGRLTKLFDKLAARKPGDCPNFRVSENGTVPFAAAKPPKTTDPKAAEKAATSDDLKSGTWAVRKTRFADHDVYYMVRAQGESAGVLTWCLVKKELVWSLSPQNVKAYLLRQSGGPSLADEPAVIEALRDKRSPTLLMYEDSRRMFRMTYPLMQGWAMVAAAQDGLPTDGIDPMLLPAGPTIAKYLRPAVSTLSVAPKGVQLTMHQSLPNGNLGATLYCVLCSLLPANAGAFAEQVSPAVGAVNGAAGISPIVPRYMADPTRRTEELTFTGSVPAAANPNGKAGDSAPACVPSDAARREFARNPSSSSTPAPPSATAAPCVPPPVYASTSTPEGYRPQYSATPQNAPGYASATAPQVPYDVAGGYGAPTPSVPMPYAVPCVPPAPRNPNPPLGWAPAMPPYSSVPPAPPGYQPVIVYVPMVIYMPAAAGPGGNPPPSRLPAVYPPPSYAPRENAVPNYAPPPATFDPYAPNTPPPAAQSSAPSPQSSFDTLMDVVGKKLAQGKSAEVERPLRQLSRCPDLSAEQRSQVAGLLQQIRGSAAQPPIVVAGPVVSTAQVAIPAGNYFPVAAPGWLATATPPTFAPTNSPSVAQKPSARPLHQTFTEEEGSCALKKHGGSDKDIFAVEVGNKLHGTFKFYVEDSADGPHITTDALVENSSKTARHFRYEIALLDKSGEPINFFPKNVSGEGDLAGRGLACKGRDDTCSLLVPEGTAETVASYRVRFWESDKTPAKKK